MSASPMPEPGSAAADLDALIALLTKEIAAIENGDLQSVEALLPAKSALFETFEQRQGELESALSGPEGEALREKVHTLKALAARDGELLDLTREAVAGVADEIARIRDRHSLKGLYGKGGEQVADNGSPRQQIDRSV